MHSTTTGSGGTTVMGTRAILRYATLFPQHVAALVLVDGLMLDGPARSGRGAAMGGPEGRKNRKAQIDRFFVPSTPPAAQGKSETHDASRI